MSSPSDRLDQMLSQQRRSLSRSPDIKELTQLLCDVTHDEKVRILKSHATLIIAARFDHTEMITTILSSVPQHQRLDVLLVREYTPLHCAAGWGKSDSVETILTHLTPNQQLKILSVRDLDGHTPADTASQGIGRKTERLLRDYQQRAEKQISEEKVATLERKLQSSNQTNTELTDNNKEKDKIIQGMKTELHSVKSEMASLKSAGVKLQDVNDSLQGQITQMKEQKYMLEKSVNELTDNNKAKDKIIQGVKTENDETKKRLHSVESEMASVKSAGVKQQDENVSLQGQITQMKEQNYVLEKSVNELTRENTQLKTELQETVIKLLDREEATQRNTEESRELEERVKTLGCKLEEMRILLQSEEKAKQRQMWLDGHSKSSLTKCDVGAIDGPPTTPAGILDQIFERYTTTPSQYPNVVELVHLLSNVTNVEKALILKRRSPLHTAVVNDHTVVITIILSSVPQHQRLSVLLLKYINPLYGAALMGKSVGVEAILKLLTSEQQIKLMSTRCYDKTPADIASQNGHKETVEMLNTFEQEAREQRDVDGSGQPNRSAITKPTSNLAQVIKRIGLPNSVLE